MIFTAEFNTYLKAFPIAANSLLDSDKRYIGKGETLRALKVLQHDGLNVSIDFGSCIGKWWLFKPHWSAKNDGVEATFMMSLRKSTELLYGSLVFSRASNILLKVSATSGLAGHQYKGAWAVKNKGCIPPALDWKLSTRPHKLAVKNSALFFHITPDPRFNKSELGLHKQTNLLNNAASIITPASDFDRKIVPMLTKLDCEQVNLAVLYF